MRRPVLALLALLPAASMVGPEAPAAAPAMPSGAVVFRPECFGGGVDLGVGFLQQIPSGRTFQSAVTTAPGAT
ncbi:MAG: hypothetical protein ABMB14_36805, partial [Myxococcota bacterium]